MTDLDLVYPEQHAPRHILATCVSPVFALLALLTARIVYIVSQRVNRQHKQTEKSILQATKGEARANIAGLTDKESRDDIESFRYIT
jgi:uncharacterized protein YpmS